MKTTSEKEIMDNANYNIKYISFLLIVISILLILIMIITTTYDNPLLSGWIAALGASFVFGGTGIPMKACSIDETEKDALIFSLYSTFGIVIVNTPVLIYLLINNTFIFMPWAILGSIDIILVTYLAFYAVKEAGYAKAPAMWCSMGMLTSFLQGIIIFQEPVHKLHYEIIAIMLLIFGVVIVNICQTNIDSTIIEQSTNSSSITWEAISTIEFNVIHTTHDKDSQTYKEDIDIKQLLNSDHNCHHNNENIPDMEWNPVALNDDIDHENKRIDISMDNSMDNQLILNSSKNFTIEDMEDGDELRDTHKNGLSNTKDVTQNIQMIPSTYHILGITIPLYGIVICILMGFCDGSLMAPFKISNVTNLQNILSYLASFSIGSIIIVPIILLFYLMYIYYTLHLSKYALEIQLPSKIKNNDYRNRIDHSITTNLHDSLQILLKKLNISILNGTMMGVLWASGNFLSVHATYYLGMKVGFPLTQTCVVFSSLWGIFYFKEINIYRNYNGIKFILGVLAIILGAYFMVLGN